MVMQASTGQTLMQRLQATHSSSTTAKRRATLRPDHDGPEDVVVGGGGEDLRETGGEFGEGEVFGHWGFPGEVAWPPGE